MFQIFSYNYCHDSVKYANLGPVSANAARSYATFNGSTHALVSTWCTWYWAAAILWAGSCSNSSSGDCPLCLLCSACPFRCESFLVYRDLHAFFGSRHSVLLLLYFVMEHVTCTLHPLSCNYSRILTFLKNV